MNVMTVVEMAKEKNIMKQIALHYSCIRMHWETQNEKCEVFIWEEGEENQHMI